MPLKEIEAQSAELRFGITFPNTQDPNPTTFLCFSGAAMRSPKKTARRAGFFAAPRTYRSERSERGSTPPPLETGMARCVSAEPMDPNRKKFFNFQLYKQSQRGRRPSQVWAHRFHTPHYRLPPTFHTYGNLGVRSYPINTPHNRDTATGLARGEAEGRAPYGYH